MAKRIKSPYKAWRRYRNRENTCTTLHKVFDYATTNYAKRIAYQFVDGGQQYTYADFRTKTERLSQRMSRFGIKHGDRVAIFSQNMPNWVVAFFSATAFGRVAVPILPDSSEHELTNILTHSESKAIFISKRMLPKLSEECKQRLTLIIDIETFEFLKKNKEDFKCNGWVKDPQPDDLACIIYTSGTTGKAKGVMLSHRNLSSNLAAAFKAKPAFKKDRFLSILPAAHAYEMSVSTLYSFYVGATCYTLQKPPTPTILLAAMKKVKPTIVCSVPLIIEKVVKNSVLPTIQKSRVLSWADQHIPRILRWFIGRRMVRTFGGKLEFFGIGGAKLDPMVEQFLIECKFPYAIGYGLTETAPLVCNVMVDKKKHLGSIGVASYKVDIRLDNVNPANGEGEIVVRGNNVMLGYYKDPERTLQVLDDEGWFHTNDVATMDEQGNYYIKGRLNNTILGPSGENIYPEEIEQVINNIEGVEESLVMERDGKLVALVKFNDNAIDWDQATEDKWFEELEARKKAVLDWVNKKVGKNSKIGEVDAMKEPFEKTATQKIRRFKYKDSHGDEPEKPESTDTSSNKSDQ
ncbi:MAG: AMP-binding protein [Bacteroidales bacterium]|nr:AMP-binding protein [Bacteroidales bacterium]